MTGRRPRRRLAGLLVLGAILLAAALPPVSAAREMGAAGPASVVLGLLPPIAVNDATSAVHGQLRTVAAPGVLANDLQLGGGYTAVLVTNVANGTLTLDPDGGYRYRSNASFVGTDTFRYRVDGGLLGLSNTATVTITVTNTAPVARSDAFTATAGVERSIAAPGVLADDTDADGDALSAALVSGPANGTVSLSANGSFRYTADASFVGVDTFRYRATDGVAWSATVSVDMTVSAPSPTPTPTPAPTPTPTPTPGPSASGGASPAPGQTVRPGDPAVSPSLPARSEDPARSDDPASPGPGAAASGAPGASAAVGGGGAGSGGGSPGDSGTPAGSTAGPFVVGAGGGPVPIDLDSSFATFDGFEWAIPAVALSVPLILMLVAMIVQALIGLAWIPLTRRWLGTDRRRRPRVTIR